MLAVTTLMMLSVTATQLTAQQQNAGQVRTHLFVNLYYGYNMNNKNKGLKITSLLKTNNSIRCSNMLLKDCHKYLLVMYTKYFTIIKVFVCLEDVRIPQKFIPS